MDHRAIRYARTFGKHLKTLRSEKGLTQGDLSIRSKLSMGYISRIERGEANPSISVILAISKALHIAPKKLLMFDSSRRLEKADKTKRH